jgi:2,3-bisphosphoglycerate-dependent phosphoglycerate mutase
VHETALTLIRHAETTGGPGDPGLSAAGQAQAARLARSTDRLTKVVVSSPLNRAKATAGIVAAELGVAVEVDQRLRERINWGDIPGQALARFLEEWERTRQDPSYMPQGGRSVADVASQMSTFCDEMKERAPRGSVLAVTHGGVIAALLGVVLSGHERTQALARCGAMPFCSRTVLAMHEGEVVVRDVASSPP